MAMLKANYGGIVACVKPGEPEQWLRYCRRARREEDLIIVTKESQFNPFQWQASVGLGTHSQTQLIRSLSEIVHRGKTGGGESKHWQEMALEVCARGINVLKGALVPVSASSILQLASSAPTHPEQLKDEQWQASSYFATVVSQGDARVNQMTEGEYADYTDGAMYFMRDWTGIAPETRGSISVNINLPLAPLTRGELRTFMNGMSFTPEMCQQGKIILLDMPIFTHGEAGLLAQGSVIQAFMQSMQRRHFTAGDRSAFLFVDEFQYLVTSYWQEFLTTSRSSGVAPVCITQGLPNIQKALGDKAAAEALSGLLVNHFYCANGCNATNNFAAERIGRTLQAFDGWNMSGDQQRKYTPSYSANSHYELEIQGRAFSQLLRGGLPHKTVEAIFHAGGRDLGGYPWLLCRFQQG